MSPLTAPPAGQKAIELLCRAIRLDPDAPLARRLEADIQRRLDHAVSSSLPAPGGETSARPVRLEKAVLLKPPMGPREPGVLYIAFEYQWQRLLTLPMVEEFAKNYTLVLAPSWSPPHSHFNFYFPRRWPMPVFVQISHPKDMDYLPRLSSRYGVLPLTAAHWVNPDWFQPRPTAGRDLDLVMVANFARFKRHVALFHALRRLPVHWRVALIGQREGNRTAEHVRREAAAFGVADRFLLRESAPHAEVCETLCRARASVVLSRREGSCVVVAESLFANTPVGMLADAHIGSRSFINEHTGRLLDERELMAGLRALVEEAHRYQPRSWALAQGISCHESSRRLNQILREAALAAGQAWTCDLAPLQWRPNPELVHAADVERLAPARRELEERWHVRLGPASVS